MKKKILLIIIGLFILLPFNTKALGASINFNCDKSKLGSNESMQCTINVPVTSGNLVGFEAYYSATGGLTISNFNQYGWQGDGNDGHIALYTDTGFSGNVGIGKFTVTAPANFSGSAAVNLTGIVLAGDGAGVDKVRPGDVSRPVTAKSTNSSLSSLSVNTGTLSPAFSPSTTTYNVTTDAASITISGSAEGSVSGLGSFTLNYGDNSYKITVTAEAGNSTTYTVNVKRPDNRSTVNTLKTLSISKGSLNFSSDKTSYSVEVDSSVEKVTINSSLTDSKSRYTAGSSSFTKSLNYGVNTVTITVQAENGASRTYTIKITRKDDRSKDTTLKEIKIGNNSVSLQKDKYDYEIKVDYDQTKLDIKALVNDSKAKVEVKGNYDKLEVGENLIEIIVTAENGETKTYKLKVIRQTEDVKLSTDSSLKSLSIEGYDINFSKNTKSYTITIGKETSLNIKAKANDSKAKVDILGNSLLEDGSTVTIVVTAEDGTSTEYVINIEKKKSSILPIILIALAAIIIGVVLFLILGKKKKEAPTEEVVEEPTKEVPVVEDTIEEVPTEEAVVEEAPIEEAPVIEENTPEE